MDTNNLTGSQNEDVVDQTIIPEETQTEQFFALTDEPTTTTTEEPTTTTTTEKTTTTEESTTTTTEKTTTTTTTEESTTTTTEKTTTERPTTTTEEPTTTTEKTTTTTTTEEPTTTTTEESTTTTTEEPTTTTTTEKTTTTTTTEEPITTTTEESITTTTEKTTTERPTTTTEEPTTTTEKTTTTTTAEEPTTTTTEESTTTTTEEPTTTTTTEKTTTTEESTTTTTEKTTTTTTTEEPITTTTEESITTTTEKTTTERPTTTTEEPTTTTEKTTTTTTTEEPTTTTTEESTTTTTEKTTTTERPTTTTEEPTTTTEKTTTTTTTEEPTTTTTEESTTTTEKLITTTERLTTTAEASANEELALVPRWPAISQPVRSPCIGASPLMTFAYPKDSKKYIKCLDDFHYEIRSCPNGSEYDEETSRCNFFTSAIDRCKEEKPCLNNGECIPLPDGEFQCSCHHDWTGDRCQIPKTTCAKNPCGQNAECRSLKTPDYKQDYVCICHYSKTYGLNCQDVRPNPCLSSDDQYFPFEFSRRVYIQCHGEIMYFQRCGPLTFWDQEALTCDAKRSAKFVMSGSKTRVVMNGNGHGEKGIHKEEILTTRTTEKPTAITEKPVTTTTTLAAESNKKENYNYPTVFIPARVANREKLESSSADEYLQDNKATSTLVSQLATSAQVSVDTTRQSTTLPTTTKPSVEQVSTSTGSKWIIVRPVFPSVLYERGVRPYFNRGHIPFRPYKSTEPDFIGQKKVFETERTFTALNPVAESRKKIDSSVVELNETTVQSSQIKTDDQLNASSKLITNRFNGIHAQNRLQNGHQISKNEDWSQAQQQRNIIQTATTANSLVSQDYVLTENPREQLVSTAATPMPSPTSLNPEQEQGINSHLYQWTLPDSFKNQVENKTIISERTQTADMTNRMNIDFQHKNLWPNGPNNQIYQTLIPNTPSSINNGQNIVRIEESGPAEETSSIKPASQQPNVPQTTLLVPNQQSMSNSSYLDSMYYSYESDEVQVTIGNTQHVVTVSPSQQNENKQVVPETTTQSHQGSESQHLPTNERYLPNVDLTPKVENKPVVITLEESKKIDQKLTPVVFEYYYPIEEQPQEPAIIEASTPVLELQPELNKQDMNSPIENPSEQPQPWVQIQEQYTNPIGSWTNPQILPFEQNYDGVIPPDPSNNINEWSINGPLNPYVYQQIPETYQNVYPGYQPNYGYGWQYMPKYGQYELYDYQDAPLYTLDPPPTSDIETQNKC